MRINKILSKRDYIPIIFAIVFLIAYVILILFPENFSLSYGILLILMIYLGYIPSSFLIWRIEKKYSYNQSNKRYPHIEKRQIGRPLEFIFFIALFSATYCISTSFAQEDLSNKIIYFSLAIFCYSIAIFCGWNHYIKKIYN